MFYEMEALIMQRLKVGASFSGWSNIEHLIREADNPRDKLLALTLFKTGGRISEVLSLTKEHILMDASKYSIIVSEMKVLKKFAKGKGSIDYYRSIPILRQEPLTDQWEALLSQQKHQVLFPGWSWKTSMTRDTSYKIMRGLGEKTGIRINDHWFRGQRASQLSQEYMFSDWALNRFFGWTPRSHAMITASKYSGRAWQEIELWMLQGLKRKRMIESGEYEV